MSEDKPAGVKGAIAGWIKGLFTSVVGLLSGAVLMYVTPLVNNTIKPAKPLANFATEVAGLSVTFHDHSSGGSQGWWDFGDGSALAPFKSSDANMTHTYAKPGTYSVKLSLENLLGEGSERSVTINVDGAATAATAPAIEQFDAEAIGSDRVPATFKLVSKIKNATCSILMRGDDHPLQLDVDSMNQDRYVVFEKPGTYTLRLAALNGKDIVEKTKIVTVKVGDAGEPLARLRVTYEARKIRRDERRFSVQCVWDCDPTASVCPFREERPVSPGHVITAADLVNKNDKDAPVQNVKLAIAPDKTRVILSGELVKPRTFLPSRTSLAWLADIKIATERRSQPQLVNRGDVMVPIALNTVMKLPMPPLEDGWEVIKRNVSLDLLEGQQKVFETAQPVTGAKVTLKNQPCIVSMTAQKNSIWLKVEAPTLVNVGGVLPAPSATPIVTPLIVRPTMPVVAPRVERQKAGRATPVVAVPTRFERLPGLSLPK